MADSTIANSLAETSVTGGNDDDPVDVLWRNVQHLLCQAEKDWQTIQMYQGECDQLEAIRKKTQYELEAAWRRHHSHKDKIQELQAELLKMKSEAEPPRPSLSTKAQGDENFHLKVHRGKKPDTMHGTEVRGGKGATVSSETVLARQWYYLRNRETILARNRVYHRTAKGQAARLRKVAKRNMKRILELQERGNGATLDQLGEVFMRRCKSSASRDALARLLAARDGSVGTSASASGSSEASSGSGGGVPSPAAAARRKGSTLQWLGDVPADAEGEPPSKKMKQAGPTEDDNQK